MKIQQLSVFVENKPGHVIVPCRLLAQAGVDLRALSLADPQRFGILRMIVSDVPRAISALEQEGFVAKATEVLPSRWWMPCAGWPAWSSPLTMYSRP